MAWKIEIGRIGSVVDRTSLIRREGGAGISLTANERSQAHFTTLPGYRPNLREEVRIYAQDGVTLLFGGVVYQRKTASSGAVMFTEVDCADWSIYGDWCTVDLTYAAATTLQVVLDALVAKLAAYGVTLDATNYTGVALDPFAWAGLPVTDCLRALTDKTGFIWQFSTTKVLSLVVPGTTAAVYNLSDATPHCTVAEWQDESSKYATRVKLICGPTGAFAVTQSWTADGTTTSWVTDFPSAGVMPSSLTVGGVAKTFAGTTAFAARCFLGLTINPLIGPVYDPTLNFANNESVTLAGRTYTFKTTLTPASGEILIQPTGTESFNALICAIMNYDGGKGTTWAAATPSPHADIVAYWGKPNEVVCRAKVAGTAGNAYPCTTTAAYLKVYGEGNINLTTFDIGEDAAGAQYEFDIPTHTLSVGTDSVPTNGTILTLVYLAQFPFAVEVGTDAFPVVEFVTTAPTIMTWSEAFDLASAILMRMGGSQKTVTFTSLEGGWLPGRSLSIVLTDRALNIAAAWIQTVEIKLVSATWWEYTITAIEGADYLGSPLEYFRKLIGSTVLSSGGGGTVVVSGESIHYLGGSRFHAVQVPA
jgi:hypothetical protein